MININGTINNMSNNMSNILNKKGEYIHLEQNHSKK